MVQQIMTNVGKQVIEIEKSKAKGSYKPVKEAKPNAPASATKPKVLIQERPLNTRIAKTQSQRRMWVMQ